MSIGPQGHLAAISHFLAKAGHERSDCPPHARVSRPEKFSSGFLVWKSWDDKTLVRHNINEEHAAQMGSSVAEYTRYMLDAYEATLKRSDYRVTRDGDRLVVGERG